MSGKIIVPNVPLSNFRLFGETRSQMLISGNLFDVSKFANGNGTNCPTAITSKLFRMLYPWAEDGVKGICFDERLMEMLKAWKGACRFSVKAYGEFQMIIESYVKSYDNKNHKAEVYMDGLLNTKKLDLFCAYHPGDDGDPVLTFGLVS